MTIAEHPPQHMQALALANRRRLAGAELRKDLAGRRITIAAALTDDRVSKTITVGELLACQWRWGPGRVAKACRDTEISEAKRVVSLTERQRGLIVQACR